MELFKKVLRDKKNFNNLLTALFIGILLLIISSTLFKTDKKSEDKNNDMGNITQIQEKENEDSYEKTIESELEATLSLVEGVGRVKVLINTSESSENVLKNDTNYEKQESGGDTKSIEEEKTVIVNDNEPIVLKKIKPKIVGIIVVADGGDNVLIKEKLINAIQALLGVEAHKIEILKMK